MFKILAIRDGVLEDTFWSPWPWSRRSSPWPRSLKSSKTVLSSARKQHYFLNGENFEDRLKKNFWTSFWRSPENFFWRPFFFESTWRLCSWSLALGSNIPVLDLESVCPRKSWPWPWPRIFLCPWLWPRALCPRLHLCLQCSLKAQKSAKCFLAFLHKIFHKCETACNSGVFRFEKRETVLNSSVVFFFICLALCDDYFCKSRKYP